MKRTARKSNHLLLALVLAAGFLFATSGTVYATESVEYVEKSWDVTRVVSETKTEEALPLTSDTEYIQGRYYVRGTIESSKRLKVVEGAEALVSADVEPQPLRNPLDGEVAKLLKLELIHFEF